MGYVVNLQLVLDAYWFLVRIKTEGNVTAKQMHCMHTIYLALFVFSLFSFLL